jgi:hypothetical protein
MFYFNCIISDQKYFLDSSISLLFDNLIAFITQVKCNILSCLRRVSNQQQGLQSHNSAANYLQVLYE